jgi:DNA-binding PadR family transcriptional regulator
MALEHAILGFLDYAPMSGYDLKKTFDESVRHFWTAQQSQIYRTLKRMQQDGWVRIEVVKQDDRPDRKVYHITPTGRQELERWLAAPAGPELFRSEWLVKVFFASRLGDSEIHAMFRERADTLRAKFAHLQDATQGALDEGAAKCGEPRDCALWQLTLEYGIAYYRWELEWMEQAMERLARLPPGADRAGNGENAENGGNG